MKNNLALASIAGILFAFSFPPFKTGFFAYGALIPFFLLLEQKSFSESVRWGYITGFFINLFTLFWIGWVTKAGLVGVLLVLPLFTAFYALLHTLLIKKLHLYGYFFVPFLWTTIEFLQLFGETAFPWTAIGYSQTYYLPLIQYAEITSVYGVSFFVVVVNALLFLMVKEKDYMANRIAIVIVLLVVFAASFIYGGLRLNDAALQSGKSIKVAILQGNVDPFEKWEGDSDEKNYRLYENFILEAAVEKPDIFILPETALPFYIRFEPRYLRKLYKLADSLNVPILTGALEYEYRKDDDNRYYNASFLIEPKERDLEAYKKTQLVPFSERVPYKRTFPFNVMQNLLFDMALGIGNFSSGIDYSVFDFSYGSDEKQDAIKFSTPICFESVFPNIDRRFTENGADFLAIITNDAWFGKTTAPYQHTQIAVFRAIENRIPIARAANTGISCLIDKYGRVRQQTKIFTKDIVIGELFLRNETTFYTQKGNVFALSVTGITIFALLFAFIKRHAKKLEF